MIFFSLVVLKIKPIRQLAALKEGIFIEQYSVGNLLMGLELDLSRRIIGE